MATKAKLDTGPLNPPLLRHLECPTPQKRGYGAKKWAKLAIKSTRGLRNRDDVKPYLCSCGLWHNGHQPGSKGKRLSKQAKRLRGKGSK